MGCPQGARDVGCRRTCTLCFKSVAKTYFQNYGFYSSVFRGWGGLGLHGVFGSVACERGWSGGGGINSFQECHWVVGLFLLAKHITSSFTRVPCVYAQGIYNILNLSTCSASDSQVAQGAQTDMRSTIERSSGRRSIASSDRSRCSLRSRLGTRCIVPVAARQADWVCSQRVRC